MAVTTKKIFPATTNATTTVFSPVSIQLNNQDDLDVYVTLSGGTRVLQLRQSTGSTAQSSHPQVNNTDGLYFPAVSAGTTLYNYQLSTDNNTITFNSALPQGAVVSCERRTRDASGTYTTFASGSTIRATDLNNSSTESNFTAQDARNKAFDLEGKLFNGPADNTIKTKLDGIEANATADQTASEIRALVESASDSNVFTDADHTKLNGIETGATADQTGAEIKSAYEAQSDTNAFTDAEKTKLSGIEASATADQTAAEIRTLVESASDSNVFTDADHTKLNGIEAGATADQTNAEIRAAVEAATDSNVFTDADHTKLNGIATGADVTSSNSINALTDVNTSGVADGKILKYQASSSSFIIADDTGGSQGATTFTGLTDTPSNYGSAANKTLKVNSSGNAVEFVDVSTDIVSDTTPQLGGNLDVQANEITTSTTNGNVKLTPNGTGVVEVKGAGGNDGTLQLNCSQNSHGVKIKSPAHSAGASYTLTLPNTDGNANQVLKTDGSGNLDWVDQTTDTNTQLSNAEVRTAVEAASDSNVFTDADHTKLNGIATSANNYSHPNHSGEVTSSGDGAMTIADDVVDEANLKVSNSPTNGYFLSAQSGNTGGLTWAEVDLTSLSASNLTSGTIPDARFPATLPAVSGANLTGLSSTKAGGAIYENSQTISVSHTIPTGSNGMSAGPVTVNNGVTLTISSGSTYTVV